MKFSKTTFLKFLKNKYFIISFVFVLYITLFSQNNLIERLSEIHDLNKLEQQKEYYLKIIKENTEKIRELRTDKANLEKFAREEYLMKKNNEDIFVIVKK
ncbi:MAG: septum formation initiator [Bacteroidetes bacterium CG02_land_8_20_14_3_00_31_25]|nr:MAG: septum formation initiator [Bacteroidetes bacterium CG02_land_8_20_14_3_00_31_25]PIY04344.1 MAG: septum formation initiator [Bacteroidetes bacterium CG_4_10_14_3_um_filter_31_20]